MIYITQLIYLNKGQEAVFNEFEAIAIPIIGIYNGKLMLRIRPDFASYIETNIEKPYEVHLIEFQSEADFRAFMNDAERKKYLYLKEKAIKISVLYKGEKI
jgi:hypothetical protein